MKYIGTILYGIIEIIILLAIFQFPATPAESLIIVIVILTYITIRAIGSGLAMSLILILGAVDAELTKLKTIMGHADERTSDEIEELSTGVKKNRTKFYIQSGIIFILYLISIWKLISLLWT